MCDSSLFYEIADDSNYDIMAPLYTEPEKDKNPWKGSPDRPCIHVRHADRVTDMLK